MKYLGQTKPKKYNNPKAHILLFSLQLAFVKLVKLEHLFYVGIVYTYISLIHFVIFETEVQTQVRLRSANVSRHLKDETGSC